VFWASVGFGAFSFVAGAPKQGEKGDHVKQWVKERWDTRASRLHIARLSNEVDRLAKRLDWLGDRHEDLVGEQVQTWLNANPTIRDRKFITVWGVEEAGDLIAGLAQIITDLESIIYEGDP